MYVFSKTKCNINQYRHQFLNACPIFADAPVSICTPPWSTRPKGRPSLQACIVRHPQALIISPHSAVTTGCCKATVSPCSELGSVRFSKFRNRAGFKQLSSVFFYRGRSETELHVYKFYVYRRLVVREGGVGLLK